MNSPRMSKPSSVAPSPTSQQNFVQQPMSLHQLHSESDIGGHRVTFSQSNLTGNHTINFTNSQKDSIEVHDGQDADDADEPLLVKQPSSKSS